MITFKESPLHRQSHSDLSLCRFPGVLPQSNICSRAIIRYDHSPGVQHNLMPGVLKAYSRSRRSHLATRTDINLGSISEVHTAS